MTADQLLNRLEQIRQKDKRGVVYYKLIKLPVEQVVAMIEKVDDILFDEQIDQCVREFKLLLKQ